MSEETSKRLGILGSTWKAAGTGIAVLASAVALTFTLWPGLVPDPHTVLAAKLDVQTVDHGVSQTDYLKRYEPGAYLHLSAALKQIESNSLGDVVLLQVQTQGRKHSNVELKTVLYDWQTRQALPDAPQAQGWRADTPDDEWIAPIWVADPGHGRDFFARLLLMDGPTILALADSPRIPTAG